MTFTITRRDAFAGGGSLLAALFLANLVLADGHSTHEVLMLNKGLDNPKKQDVVFSQNLADKCT